MLQVVGFELDAIKLVISTQLLDFLFGILLTHHHIAVLILRELIEEIVVGESCAIICLGAKILWNLKVWHDRAILDVILLALAHYLHGVAQSLGHIAEQLVHLGSCLEPFLKRISHAVWVIKILACVQADKMIVCLTVILIDEVDIIGCNKLDTMLCCHLLQESIIRLLLLIALRIKERIFRWMALHLKVIVIAKEVLMP